MVHHKHVILILPIFLDANHSFKLFLIEFLEGFELLFVDFFVLREIEFFLLFL